MNLSDLIGVIVTFGMVIYMMMRWAAQERERKLHPELEEERLEDEEEELQRYLQEIGLREEDIPHELKPVRKKVVPPSKPQPVRTPPKLPSYTPPPVRRVETPYMLDKVSQPAGVYDTTKAYEIENKELPSRVEKLLKNKPSLQDMVIYHELFGLPKAFRDE